MRKLILDLNSLENTDEIARKMAANLFPGAILLLWGSMGAGKTTFAKSLCAGLGVLPEIVTSPTYTLVNIYPGDWPVFHVDLYRPSTTSFSTISSLLTLFSKFFSSFLRSTCSLSVSHKYLALEEVYLPFRAAIPNNPTLRNRSYPQASPNTGLSPSLASYSKELMRGP